MRISLTNTPPEGVRWQVIERGTTLKAGIANTEFEARASAARAIKEIETERFVSAIGSNYEDHPPTPPLPGQKP
jgi:hypothetical protein